MHIEYTFDPLTDYMRGQYITQLKYVGDDHIEILPYPRNLMVMVEPIYKGFRGGKERLHELERIEIRYLLEEANKKYITEYETN